MIISIVPCRMSCQMFDSLIEWWICIWVGDLTFPLHLGLNWQAHCAQHQFKGALLLSWSSRWPTDLHCWCPLASRRMSPDMQVCVKPKLHTHKECGPRFHPLLHTSYTMVSLTALLGEHVSSGSSMKARNLALEPRQGPEMNSRACLWVLPDLNVNMAGRPVTFSTGCSNSLINARYCRYSVMSCRWWVKYHLKHVEQLTDLNKLYSVASWWIIIAVQLGKSRHIWEDNIKIELQEIEWEILYFIYLK